MPEHFNEMIKMNALHDEKFNLCSALNTIEFAIRF
jgi:hypothetical protein